MTHPQRDTLLNALVAAGDDGICAQQFSRDHHIGRLAARKREFVEDGWQIEKRRCTDAWHAHTRYQIRYVLVNDGQMVLSCQTHQPHPKRRFMNGSSLSARNSAPLRRPTSA